MREGIGAKWGMVKWGEEVLGVPVEYHATDGPPGKLFLGPQFSIVERIEVEFGMLIVGHDLDLHLPLGILTTLYGFIEILGGVVEISSLNGICLLLGQVLDTLLGNPVILHQHSLSIGIHPLVGINA